MTLVLLILEMATKTKQIKIPNMSCQLYKLDLSINSGGMGANPADCSTIFSSIAQS